MEQEKNTSPFKDDTEQTEANGENSSKRRKNKEKEDVSPFSRAGDIVMNIILTVFIVLTALLLIVKAMNINIYTILTGSMSPSYPINSIVFTKEVDPLSISSGDVITFAVSDTAYVTHRVVDTDTENRTFTTKGDANTSNDASPVSWGNVIGKVMFSIPFGGGVFRWITAEENRTLIIVLLISVFSIALIWEIAGKIIQSRRNKKMLPEEKLSEEQENLYTPKD